MAGSTETTTTMKLFPHFIYLALIGAILIFVHCYQQERDQRVLAEATIKTAQQTVSNLQQQIATTNSQAQSQKVALDRALNAIKTPAQVVAAIPRLTDIPLNARPVANDPVDVTVAAIPLAEVLTSAKETSVALGACQSDLKAETAIADQKDVEIKALKKKPKFWHRVGSTLKTVAVGIGIGVIAAHAL